MIGTLAFVATVAIAVAAFVWTRRFVHNRLRYVDNVQRPAAPIVAGAAAAIVALPVVAVLPLVGAGTALLFGASVGFGTRAGAYRIRSGYMA